MDTLKAYNAWATQYDTNANRTRDLEALALREAMAGMAIGHGVEIGCGTGKNTVWLAQNAEQLTAVDFSEAMLLHARRKVQAPHVNFITADITEPWHFAPDNSMDWVGCSLVLEHIEDLAPIFKEAYRSLKAGGRLYIGELHPFKQYAGSKARFEDAQGNMQEAGCFTHHLSDFIQTGLMAGFKLQSLQEHFDEGAALELPRILSILFEK